MKPAPFEYLAPDSLEEALSLLAEHRGSAKILAGGQSLVPLMAFRLVRPSVLIDLRKVGAFSGYDFTGDTLTIGSMVTHRTVELDERVTSRCPMLGEALGVVGHVAIRNVGTVGGSLAHADPAAEWPALTLALDAEMTIASSVGSRVVSADEFITNWMTTCLAEDELLVSVRMQLPGFARGSAFEEVARRHGDFAIVGVAAVVTVAGSIVADARIALAGADLKPVRATSAESVIIGTELSAPDLVAAGEAAAAESDPIADLHATVGYKRRLADVLTRRVLARAFDRATSAA